MNKISPAFLGLTLFLEEEALLDKHKKHGILSYAQERKLRAR